MKSLAVVMGMLSCVLLMACEAHKNAQMTSDPKADSPGSGAKMLDSAGTIHTDSVIIDSTNYGPPKN